MHRKLFVLAGIFLSLTVLIGDFLFREFIHGCLDLEIIFLAPMGILFLLILLALMWRLSSLGLFPKITGIAVLSSIFCIHFLYLSVDKYVRNCSATLITASNDNYTLDFKSNGTVKIIHQAMFTHDIRYGKYRVQDEYIFLSGLHWIGGYRIIHNLKIDSSTIHFITQNAYGVYENELSITQGHF